MNSASEDVCLSPGTVQVVGTGVRVVHSSN